MLFLSVAEQAPRPKALRGCFLGKKHYHKDAVISGSGFPFSILNGGLSIHEKKLKYVKCLFTEVRKCQILLGGRPNSLENTRLKYFGSVNPTA